MRDTYIIQESAAEHAQNRRQALTEFRSNKRIITKASILPYFIKHLYNHNI